MNDHRNAPPGNALAKTTLDRNVAGAIELKTSGGLVPRNAGEAMEIAKMMSISGIAVRSFLRNNAGACLAVAIQAWEWGMNPFAVAAKSYSVNDQISYESALFNAVATRRAPIEGRLRIAYDGEGPTRTCTITATVRESEGGGEVEYTSPLFKDINPKNSPLWKNDPDQQLCYFSVRGFVRRYFPDVMMGVYTVDELEDSDAPPVARQGGKRKFGPQPPSANSPGSFGDTPFSTPEPAAEAGEGEGEADPPPAEEPEQPATAAPKQGQRSRFGPE
jgi:hypothetical protein